MPDLTNISKSRLAVAFSGVNGSTNSRTLVLRTVIASAAGSAGLAVGSLGVWMDSDCKGIE